VASRFNGYASKLGAQMHDILTDKHAQEFRDYEVRFMILNPNLWVKYPGRISLQWFKIKFDASELPNVPNNVCGLYSFVVIPGIAEHIACTYLLYVGKTERNFRVRYKEYLDDQDLSKKTNRVHIREMLNKWKDHLWFCYAPIVQRSLIKQLEKDLINSYLPPYCKEYPSEVREPMKVLR
jgi:hypothetical protein